MAKKFTETWESYQTSNVPEEVLNGIYRFEREETPIYSNGKKTKIYSTDPEWQNDTLADPIENKLEQGGELTPTQPVASTKAKNHTQIFRKVLSITETNKAVKHYGYQDEMAYQMMKKSVEMKRDIEMAITQNNASVAGSTGTPGELGGIESFIETNVSRGSGGANGGYNSGTGLTEAPTDGTPREFTEDLLDEVMQLGYDNGAKFDTLHVGSFNKSKVSDFTGNATRESSEKYTVSNTIKVIENDFGTVTVAINPRQRKRTALLYDMKNIGILNLRPIAKGKLAKTHDSDEEYCITELTTRVVEGGLGAIADLTVSA